MGIKDIEEVVISACVNLGIVPLKKIYVSGDFPDGVSERIVIHVKRQVRGDIFYKGFVEVNTVVPDVNGRANHNRLQEVENILFEAFRYETVGDYGMDTYRYGLYSQQVLQEKDANYHYVNTRLTFEILND